MSDSGGVSQASGIDGASVRIYDMSTAAAPTASSTPAELAAHWRARLMPSDSGPADTAHSAPLPHDDAELAIAALAEFATHSIEAGETALLVVPDDEWLPEISNALDLDLRPFCLVLPEADFAAAITLRATLSLLRSRLSRPVEPQRAGLWNVQRERIETHADLWREALDWSAAGRTGGAWPRYIGNLFPVLILPAAQAASLQLHGQAARSALLMIHAERMMEAVPHLRHCATRLLLLRDPRISVSRELTRVDETRRLKAELEVLAQELGEMELEFATAQAELAEFTRRYHEVIGRKLVELDRLQAEIAKLLAQRAPSDATAQQQASFTRAQAEQSQRESEHFAELDKEREKPFAPSRDLKRLFRQLAQKIHPDRAENEEDRSWRTELMSEANRAYRAGDEMVLQDILDQWHEGRPEASIDAASRADTSENRTNASDAVTAQLQRQIVRLQRRIVEIDEQLNRLLASRLYELFAATNLARNRDRDLLREMAERLELQLAAAQTQLEQLKQLE